MKHLAVTLIIIALWAAAVIADLWLSEDAADTYGQYATLGLLFAGWWFWHHRDSAMEERRLMNESMKPHLTGDK